MPRERAFVVGMMCMLYTFAPVSSGQAATTYWIGSHGFWNDPNNWSDGLPQLDVDAYISNGGNAQIKTGAECDTLRLGNNPGESGHAQMASDAGQSSFYSQRIGYGGTGTFTQSGGWNSVYWDVTLGDQDAAASGTYTMTGGRLDAKYLRVGLAGSGSLNIAHSVSEINISSSLVLAERSTFAAVPGSTIHMVGGASALGSSIINRNADEADLGGLGNLSLLVENGYALTAYEAASGIDAGFNNNFALGELTIGGSDTGAVQLIDNYDNGNRGIPGTECLFTYALSINPGSSLNLAGLGLYVAGNVESTLDGWIIDGRLLDSTLPSIDALYESENGWTVVVPEPTAITVLAVASLALLRRRARS